MKNSKALLMGVLCSMTFLFVHHADAQWTQVSLPYSGNVNALAVIGTHLFAGTGGGVYHSSNNGMNWAVTGLSGTGVLSLATIGTDLFAATYSGVFLSKDSGTTWTQVNNGLTTNSAVVVTSAGTTLYAGTWNGVYKTIDSGATWTVINTGMTSIYTTAIAASGDTLFAGSSGAGIYRSLDGGSNWTKVSSAAVTAMVFCNGKMYASLSATGVISTSDHGTTWSTVNAGLSNTSMASLIAKGTTLFSGSYGGGVAYLKNNESSWTTINTGLSSTSIYSMVVENGFLFAGSYSGGVFSYSADTVLPVQLTSFDALAKSAGVALHWETATETNNYGFEIERRSIESGATSVKGWETIGFVEGNGTSAVAHSYSYADGNVASGTYAYRLKQVNSDGTSAYSSESEVTVAVHASFALNQNYPNPFNPTTTISFTLAQDGFTTLKIYDILGREVATLVNGEIQAGTVHTATFSGSNLASGIYFSRLESSGNVQMKKLVLMK